MPLKKNKNNLIAIQETHNAPVSTESSGMIIMEDLDPALISKWPKVKLKVPHIFLHKPAELAPHVEKMLSMNIHFAYLLSRYYTKIICPTFNDHKALVQYFENEQLPYHTFGHPNKRKLKVVIRGLPKNVDLDELKKELKNASIPVIRIHIMQRSENIKDTCLLLVVVPYNEEGKKLLKVKKVLGFDVKMEPPDNKIKQCHRCQMWGHTQRYCHGNVKCVKCAGDHLTKKCERDANKEPPKCANCGGEHTANFKKCPCCPLSIEHKLSQIQKKTKMLNIKSKRTECDSL